MLYAPTDVTSVNVGGRGCGRPHTITPPAPGYAHGTLNCPQCEQHVPRSWGWARNDKDVQPTCDELLNLERAQKDANQSGLAALAAMHTSASAAIPPAVLERLNALEKQNADLAAQLAAHTPAAPVDDESADAAIEKKPATRKPATPKTTTRKAA